MTFTEIQTEVLGRCNLSSTEATTRVGNAINRHYRRITSLLGMDTVRYTTIPVNTVGGTRTITAAEIEKATRVIDVSDATAIRVLEEVSLDYIRTFQTTSAPPQKWAAQNTDADSVVIVFDHTPDAVYNMTVDGWTTLAALSGASEPAFNESYHDILVWFCVSEELLRKEKGDLALVYESKAKELLGELRHMLADSPSKTTRQTFTEGRGRRDPSVGIW